MPGAIQIFIEIKRLCTGTHFFVELLIDLVAVGQAVDELRVDSFFPQIWPAIDQRRKLIWSNLARLTDSVPHLAKPRIDDCGHRFLVGSGELGFRKRVERILVFVAMIPMETHAELIESTFHEGRLEHDPSKADITGR